MTTLVTVLLDCNGPACEHTGSTSAADLDRYLVGISSVCKCHADLAAKLDVLPFDCAVSR